MTLDNLSNSRPDKFPYFLGLGVIEFLNLCSYYKSKEKHLESIQRRHG